jgi:transcription initiation factor TFIIB
MSNDPSHEEPLVTPKISSFTEDHKKRMSESAKRRKKIMDSDFDIIQMCPECGSIDIIDDPNTGEKCCKSCGLVISRAPSISRDKEWRNFDGEPQQLDRATPISNPTIINGSSSHTKIAPWSNFDGQNKKLTNEIKIEYLRLSRMNNRATGNKASLARTIATARLIYTTYKYRLNITDQIDEYIFDVFTRAVQVNLIRGRSIQQILVACIYYSLRENGIPTTMDNIQDVTGIDKKEIARCYRFMIETMKIKPTLRDPGIFVSQFVSKLNLSGEFEMTALGIYRKAKDAKITSGSSPLCIAACSIYLASRKLNSNISQKTIADVCGVTEVSIRNHVRKYQRAGIILDC